ncbi:MAG: hypothetical protein ACFWT6_11250 [Virgibacillus proomii]|jgi:hypothetical protein
MKKKSFLLAAVLSLFFVGIYNSTSVNAQGTASSEDAFYSPEFDEYVVPFKQKDNGQLEALTKEEHTKLLNNTKV